jgi:peptidoglycan/xylan/chitin deacetylase (PgdA/CDA1 family)
MRAPPIVAFTVDVEPDCPPHLWTSRGLEQGMPALLGLLEEERVPVTCFTTGDVAVRHPSIVERIVRDGHELGCHGMTHRAFTTLDLESARREIEDSAEILRRFAHVESFRAPYLRFPSSYLPLLENAGFTLDSSHGKYKWGYHRDRATTRLTRVAASTTSSVLRLPRAVRRALLAALANPVVLFVHPWEFVDLRRERLRIDCRFKTGDVALRCVRDVLRLYKQRGARFVRMRELVGSAR